MGVNVYLDIADAVDAETRMQTLLKVCSPEDKEALGRWLRHEFLGPWGLREAYEGGGPYATEMLCREAFDAPDRKAAIPAAILRERLTAASQPSLRFAEADALVRGLARKLEEGGGIAQIANAVRFPSGPLSVEQVILLKNADEPALARIQLANFRAFVALAEYGELRSQQPCVVHASF